MYVRLADLGLHDGLDGLGVKYTDRDILGDDLLVLPAERGLKVLVAEEQIVVGGGEGVVADGGPVTGDSGTGVGGAGGGGGDGHGEDGEAVLLGEAEGGGDAVEGGLEGALEGLEGQLEIDGVGGLGGLDVVVVKDEVHGERAVNAGSARDWAWVTTPREFRVLTPILAIPCRG